MAVVATSYVVINFVRHFSESYQGKLSFSCNFDTILRKPGMVIAHTVLVLKSQFRRHKHLSLPDSESSWKCVQRAHVLDAMFVLAELKDTVRIPPWKFKCKLNDAITDELNRKLANKVYLNVGLCIALHDITNIEESYIFPGDGSSHTKVIFRFIVFRPFMEEILIGRIRSCSVDGVHVTLGFFEDIVIPPHKLQHPSRFDQTEQAWVWEYDTGDGEKHDLFMDAGEIIRFRVVSETFTETLPSGPATTSDSVEKPEVKNTLPYTLSGAIDEPGLGLLTWWENT